MHRSKFEKSIKTFGYSVKFDERKKNKQNKQNRTKKNGFSKNLVFILSPRLDLKKFWYTAMAGSAISSPRMRLSRKCVR